MILFHLNKWQNKRCSREDLIQKTFYQTETPIFSVHQFSKNLNLHSRFINFEIFRGNQFPQIDTFVGQKWSFISRREIFLPRNHLIGPPMSRCKKFTFFQNFSLNISGIIWHIFSKIGKNHLSVFDPLSHSPISRCENLKLL